MSTNTAKGAALGALMSKLLSSIDAPGGVNQGVDMSKVGNIAPRTTQIPTGRYMPYSEYGARDVQPTITPELARALGLPMGMNTPSPLAQFSARPRMFTQAQPMSVTSAGTGSNININPTLSPRGNNTIDPMTGLLLGASLGYLMPDNSGSSSSGSGSNIANTLFNNSSSGFNINNILNNIPGINTVKNWFSSPSGSSSNTSSGGGSSSTPDPGYSTTPWGGIADPAAPIPFADGGMATPLMADGGQVPSYYTFGQIVNPQDILNQMAQGGEAKHGGLHVPVVEGRHDYRNGSRVTGEGDGQSDDIPAMLADGEYVFDADTVAQLGNGSTKAGSDLLDKFREEIRSHKRSAPVNKIPPPAKSPLAYMKAAQSRSNKNG
jgi:hypothetical protein